MRIATFNLENFDDVAGQEPSLAARMAIMPPPTGAEAADVLCLQEVHSQADPPGSTLDAPDTLLAGPQVPEPSAADHHHDRRPAVPGAQPAWEPALREC